MALDPEQTVYAASHPFKHNSLISICIFDCSEQGIGRKRAVRQAQDPANLHKNLEAEK